MSDKEEKKVAIRRILVAVDHSSRSEDTLKAAAMVAKITKAHVHGLYVEEEHWEHIKNLTSTTFINELTGKARILKENRVDRQVTLMANRLQRKLKALGHKHEVAHSWKSIKGQVIEEILKAGKEVDLITIGQRGSSLLHKKRLGSTAKAIIEQSEKPVLVLAGNSFTGRTITVVYDATEESQKGLRLALSISEKNKSRLSVIALKNRVKQKNDRNKELERMIDNAKVPVNVTALSKITVGNFIHLAKRQMPGLLIIPKKQPLLKEGSPELLLHYLNCSVLFMS